MNSADKIKTRFNKLQKRLRREMGQAIADYNMVEEGDRIMVCLSGGKDSYTMLDILMNLRRSAPVSFDLLAVNLDQKQPGFPEHVLPEYLQSLDVPYHVIEQDTYSVVNRVVPEGKTTCGLCSRMRRGALYAYAEEHGYNKIALGHHLDDLYENFFIRIVRGSGLKGLASLEKTNEISKINLIRPLLVFDKSDLIFISKHVFNFFIEDPSNKDFKYTRVRIRSFIDELKKEGFDKKKLFLTISNLRRSNQTLLFYVEQNKKMNSFLNQKKNELILNENFFKNPYEVIFRSLIDSIKIIGGKYNTVRGKKIDNILSKIENNVLIKETLGGCIIKKLNQTVIISKED